MRDARANPCMVLFGLAGAKGSGKNTVADYMTERYGFRQLSFAGLLKESAAACFGVDVGVWGQTKNDPQAYVILSQGAVGVRASVTVREFLQRYGTEAHRDVFGEDFWLSALGLADLEDGRYVVTDARFENECAEVVRYGGTVLYIDRDTGAVADAHASEIPPPELLIDAHVDNNGTLAELHARIDGVLAPYLPLGEIA